MYSFGSEGKAQGQLRNPYGIANDKEGNLIISEVGNHRVQIFTIGGVVLRMFGTRGPQPGQLDSPFGVAVNLEGKTPPLHRFLAPRSLSTSLLLKPLLCFSQVSLFQETYLLLNTKIKESRCSLTKGYLSNLS